MLVPEKTVSNDADVKIVGLKEFLDMNLPPLENILDPWLSTQGLALIYAPRGIGKTHVALGIAYAVASGGSFLRWKAPKPRGVLYLDGEMPANLLQERLKAIKEMNPQEIGAPFQIFAQELQPNMCVPDLSTHEGQMALEPYLENIELIIVDNIATLCRKGNENETESWKPVQDWALRMRAARRAVLFIHHAGKRGAQRGASAREDTLNMVFRLARPEKYSPSEGAVFEVHVEKSRGLMGDDIEPFKASLKKDENGHHYWITEDLQPDKKHTVSKLINAGYTQAEIAQQLGIDKSGVSRYAKQAKQEGLIDLPA